MYQDIAFCEVVASNVDAREVCVLPEKLFGHIQAIVNSNGWFGFQLEDDLLF